MEIINVSGYTFNEKVKIFNSYLLPEAIKKSGLNPEIHKFRIEETARDKIVNEYC